MSDDRQFRVATADDAEPIRQLIESAFRAEDSREGWVDTLGLGATFSIDLERVLRIIKGPDSAIIMALGGDGALAGCVGVAEKEKGLGRIFLLSVQKHHQQGGLGRQILAYAEEYCQKRWHVTRIGLNSVSVRQKLTAWYMRQGYVKTGETSPFPREEAPDMELPEDLCFVEMEKDVSP